MPLNVEGDGGEMTNPVHNELELLNHSMISKVNRIVNENERSSDLWFPLRKVARDYKKERDGILESRNPKPEPSGPQPEAEPAKDESCGFKHTIPHDDICILWPLSPAVQDILQITAVATGVVIKSGQTSLRSALGDLLLRGELLYQYGTRAVYRILPDTVVKINKSMEQTETQMLHHIHSHSQQIPAPTPFGMIAIGTWSYTFTSFIQGVSLDRIWGNLAPDKKCDLREQLDHIFAELRQLPGPSKQGHLGGGVPPLCREGHRHAKFSDTPIITEAQFNDFLLEDSLLDPARAAYIRASLPSSHQIVMTHGDLCPVNILVEECQNGLRIAGIVDWENGGAYPEYWEYVRALNLYSFSDKDDWCLYLPEAGIGRYLDEYARYCLIGRFASI